jgi:hypothetical protein
MTRSRLSSVLRSPLSFLRRAVGMSLLLAPCSLLLLFGADALKSAPVIVKNYFQRVFTNDTEGWRDTDLRAAEARVSREEVVLTGATYTVYSGDAANRPVTVFTAPSATALPGRKILRGDGPVRVVRDDLEVSGEQWAYDHVAQAITIEKNARTVIRATLPDLIK